MTSVSGRDSTSNVKRVNVIAQLTINKAGLFSSSKVNRLRKMYENGTDSNDSSIYYLEEKVGNLDTEEVERLEQAFCLEVNAKKSFLRQTTNRKEHSALSNSYSPFNISSKSSSSRAFGDRLRYLQQEIRHESRKERAH